MIQENTCACVCVQAERERERKTRDKYIQMGQNVNGWWIGVEGIKDTWCRVVPYTILAISFYVLNYVKVKMK